MFGSATVRLPRTCFVAHGFSPTLPMPPRCNEAACDSAQDFEAATRYGVPDAVRGLPASGVHSSHDPHATPSVSSPTPPHFPPRLQRPSAAPSHLHRLTYAPSVCSAGHDRSPNSPPATLLLSAIPFFDTRGYAHLGTHATPRTRLLDNAHPSVFTFLYSAQQRGCG
ncbi:hypothetical protein K438DRAFT_1970258 [Mycena galopus ATCC 62051]|nr:hypothetical protein K438DRAFT_1970258 [Mycena galopus ATCC 62051]